MTFASKIDRRLKLRLMKISGGVAVVGLLVVLREIGWHDVGVWPAGIALLLMPAAAIFFALLAASSQNTGSTAGKAGQADTQPENISGNEKKLDTSLLYRLHQTGMCGAQSDTPEQALLRLAELMPDRIIALYQLSGSVLAFSCGTRLNSRQKSEMIDSSDDLIEELSKRVNSCIDAQILRQPGKFSRPLFFSRERENEDGILLPVACNNELFAVLAVLSISERKYEVAEQELLNHFCASIAIWFYNRLQRADFNDASILEAEKLLTHRLFAGMLPESARSLPGWDIAQLSAYCDARTGDFHDYIMLPGDRMLIIAGRTSAGGLNSALYLTRLRTILDCLCESCASPADLLNRLSARFTSDKSLDLFSSLIALQLRANERSVTLAVAGHATPLINRPRSGYVEIPQLITGVPMGLFNQGVEPYQNQVIQLLPGDGILIYTDGALDFAGEKGNRLGSEDLRLLLDKMPEQYADDLLANLADQLIPDGARKRPLEDYTFIYASTE
ncbi:MAG: hypothetical protein CVV42_09365 [Candidatus Riflebacteria bacterium HGW-Riflebacteria-2]|jgi:serine phosphatase RsbU (regulator of sigma subunit)|nr:MAG: hypothetical protein CVV42_09365 [Candidatus Riflebacteria bacterium HGW-Riflebacteria-2]